MFSSIRDAFKLPDLKRRILFTIGVLFIFRLGAHIPTPGIDSKAMARLFEDSANSGLLGFLDIFAGGALSRFSIFALGVAPYINSSIVMQLLVVIFPFLEKLQKEEGGRKKIIQWTRYGAVLFAVIQAMGMTTWLRSLGIFSGDFFGMLLVVSSITAGSMAVMWLGEELSDHGIGNGISLLIFAGIVARLPEVIVRSWTMIRTGSMNIFVLLLAVILMVIVVAGCVVLQEGQRRLPVQYAKRVIGNKVYGGQSTFIPLKVNQAGVIPIIFASSVLIFPYAIASYFKSSFFETLFNPGSIGYTVFDVALIVFFAYFYTAVVFNPTDISNNMKKNGGFILGIRPGQPTSDYIEKVMARITLGGAVFLALIALIPNFMSSVMRITTFYFGGTAVLIVVGVALDTVHQIEAQLLMRHYEGILKRSGKGSGLLR
jgi:preprotein translocase subunit SecY